MTTEETRHSNDHPEADKDGKISGYLQPPDTHITKLKSKKELTAIQPNKLQEI
jgi:hypothetical protein